jgi:hypothetical protein
MTPFAERDGSTIGHREIVRMFSTKTPTATERGLTLTAAAVGMAAGTTCSATAGFATTASRSTIATTSAARRLLDVDALNASSRIDKAVELIVTLQILNLMGLGIFTLLTSIDLSQEAHIVCPSLTKGC